MVLLAVLATVLACADDPGEPALPGSGIRIDLQTGACTMLETVDPPSDCDVAVRGSLRLCSGCL